MAVMEDATSPAIKTVQRKRKLRWYQFSLRSLLIFMVICAIPCAWLAKKIERKGREREALAAIVKSGGLVQFDYEALIGANPPGPAWLRKLLGENFFCDVEYVFLSGKNFDDTALEPLSALTKLEMLDLGRSNITDAGLDHLKGLSELSHLILNRTRIDNAGLERLTGLAELRGLELWRTNVSDAGLEYLRGFAHLQALGLKETAVSDAGIVHLKQLRQLQRLDLRGTKVSDAGLRELQKALPTCEIWH
jgi:Leucine Rich repeat